MSEVREPAPGASKVARRANIILFSLNLAWMTIWYLVGHTSLGLSDVNTVFHWHFGMPEPGWVARQVVYSFVLCMPFSLVFFLLARVSRAGRHLGAIGGAFAITAFPFHALYTGEFVFNPKYLDVQLALRVMVFVILVLEPVALLVCAVLYYVRRWAVPIALNAVVLLLHFSLWAWVSGNYAGPLALIRIFAPWPRAPALQIGLRVCIMMIFHNGFPAIGFLSALSSGLDIKLSSDRLRITKSA